MARFNNPVPIVLDDNGDPIVGGKLYFYATGTSTLKTIYSDSDLSTATTNPQTSLSGGRYTGDIFLDGLYKVVQEDDNGVTIWTKDPVGDVIEGQLELWISSNTYNIPEITLGSDDEYYRSLTDGNQGNDPISSPINWEQLQFGRVWNTNVTYAIGDSSYASDGFLYFSKTSNSGNDPVSSPDDWERDNLDSPELLNNLSFTAAVATKALTFALKTKNGIDPTATDSVKIGFRNATLTTGDYSVIKGIAAASVVVPDGATLGFIASATDFVYLYAINNAGTIELAVCGQILDEDILHTTVAIGTGSDSDNVLYSTTLRSNVPIRQIGRIVIATGAVAGEWDNAPTNLFVGKTESFTDYIKLSDVQTSGTDGGSAAAATQNVRTLNTEDTDTGDNCTLAANLFTLDAGTYIISASAPALTVNNHKTRLYNVTDSSVEIIGTSEIISSTVTAATRSFVSGRFVIASAKQFRIDHYTQTAKATNGLGIASSTGDSEIYTIVELWKVA